MGTQIRCPQNRYTNLKSALDQPLQVFLPLQKIISLLVSANFTIEYLTDCTLRVTFCSGKSFKIFCQFFVWFMQFLLHSFTSLNDWKFGNFPEFRSNLIWDFPLEDILWYFVTQTKIYCIWCSFFDGSHEKTCHCLSVYKESQETKTIPC